MQRTTPHQPLSSKDNSTVKFLRSLSEPKHREKERAYLIEGIKMVEEAIRDQAGVSLFVAAPSLATRQGRGLLSLAEECGIEVLWISERLFDAISESKTPQPALAVVSMKDHTALSLFEQGDGPIVICHRLQDPGNLGTIIRTAEAVGAAGIAITPQTVDPYHPKAVRASMGSILRMPVARIRDAASYLQEARTRGFQTAATGLTEGKAHFRVDLAKRTCMIFGQEGAGLPPEIMNSVDLRIRIPMAETIDSLNVATAAAVVLYESLRQRYRGAS